MSLLACCRRRRLQDVAEGRPQELRGSRRRRHEEDVAAAGESLSRSLPGLPTRRSFVSLLQAPLKKTPVSPLATTPSPTTGDAKLRLDLRCVVCPPAPPTHTFVNDARVCAAEWTSSVAAPTSRVRLRASTSTRWEQRRCWTPATDRRCRRRSTRGTCTRAVAADSRSQVRWTYFVKPSECEATIRRADVCRRRRHLPQVQASAGAGGRAQGHPQGGNDAVGPRGPETALQGAGRRGQEERPLQHPRRSVRLRRNPGRGGSL